MSKIASKFNGNFVENRVPTFCTEKIPKFFQQISRYCSLFLTVTKDCTIFVVGTKIV